MKFQKDLLLRNKKDLFKCSFFILILIIIQMVLPFLMRWIVSNAEVKQSYLFLIICVVIYALALLIYNLVDIGRYTSLDVLGGKILQNVKEDIYNSILKSNYEKLLHIGKEKLKNILYMDTLNIFSGIACHSINIIVNSLIIIVFLVICASINIKFALVLFLASITGFIISMLSRKPISNSSMLVNQKMKMDNKRLNEYVDAIELLKTNDISDYYIEKNRNSLWNFIHTSMKVDKIQIFLKNLITGFHQLVSILIAAILSMTMKESNFGDIVYYLFISNMILDTSQSLESAIYSLNKIIPSFENVNNILNMDNCYGEKSVEKIDSIEFKNVSFQYDGNNKKILDNANYTLLKGDIVRIQAVNGGGKSTFVKLVSGLLFAKSREILINGLPINDISQKCLQNQILYINQDEILLNDEIINYAKNISGEDISELKLKELEKLVDFGTKIVGIKENGQSLSGGQRKKLLLIKLLLRYKKSSVIILDELESSLDEKTKSIVFEIENQIFENKDDYIILKITHEAKEDSRFNKFINL